MPIPAIHFGRRGFFALPAIFPALAALVSAYGIFFDPATITNNLALMNGAVPAEVLNELNQQAERIAANGRGVLSAGVIIGILRLLWSAMSGVKVLMDALNVVYEQMSSAALLDSTSSPY
jgi:membrane protein